MITQAGFVTEAWLAINPARSWPAYYKWLQHGKWSWVALGIQVAKLMVFLFPQPVWFLILKKRNGARRKYLVADSFTRDGACGFKAGSKF